MSLQEKSTELLSLLQEVCNLDQGWKEEIEKWLSKKDKYNLYRLLFDPVLPIQWDVKITSHFGVGFDKKRLGYCAYISLRLAQEYNNFDFISIFFTYKERAEKQDENDLTHDYRSIQEQTKRNALCFLREQHQTISCIMESLIPFAFKSTQDSIRKNL